MLLYQEHVHGIAGASDKATFVFFRKNDICNLPELPESIPLCQESIGQKMVLK